MEICNNRIELTEEENEKFMCQYKIGIVRQLYKDNLLTYQQLDQILKAIDKKHPF